MKKNTMVKLASKDIIPVTFIIRRFAKMREEKVLVVLRTKM